MAEIYKEFHEELGWIYVPKTIAQILVDVSKIDDVLRKIMILEFHVQALEEETRRIDTNKRQLPHCMHFLEDATEIIKQEILRWEKSEKCPVVEEFMPLKSGLEWYTGAKESKDISEKREWMSSAKLWTTPVQYDNNLDIKNQDKTLHHKSSSQGDQASGSGGKFKHKGGASMPLKKATMKKKGVDPVSSSAAESEVELIYLNVTGENPQPHEPNPQPLPKKQRRCWSPELHKQFVDALQQLGGVESATPKQIREVMNVEGLTNDEVKSHLQTSPSKASTFGMTNEFLVASTRQPTWWCSTDAGGCTPTPHKTLICMQQEARFQGVQTIMRVQARKELRHRNSRSYPEGAIWKGSYMERLWVIAPWNFAATLSIENKMTLQNKTLSVAMHDEFAVFLLSCLATTPERDFIFSLTFFYF